MNRRSFFRWLGIGTTAVVIAPKVLAEPTPNEMMELMVTTIDRELRKDYVKVKWVEFGDDHLYATIDIRPKRWREMWKITKERPPILLYHFKRRSDGSYLYTGASTLLTKHEHLLPGYREFVKSLNLPRNVVWS